LKHFLHHAQTSWLRWGFAKTETKFYVRTLCKHRPTAGYIGTQIIISFAVGVVVIAELNLRHAANQTVTTFPNKVEQPPSGFSNDNKTMFCVNTV
jgi:hypothetical protein